MPKVRDQALDLQGDTKERKLCPEPSRHTEQRLRKPGNTTTPEGSSSHYKRRDKEIEARTLL